MDIIPIIKSKFNFRHNCNIMKKRSYSVVQIKWKSQKSKKMFALPMGNIFFGFLLVNSFQSCSACPHSSQSLFGMLCILFFLDCSSTRARRDISCFFCSINFCCWFWQLSEAFWKFWPSNCYIRRIESFIHCWLL